MPFLFHTRRRAPRTSAAVTDRRSGAPGAPPRGPAAAHALVLICPGPGVSCLPRADRGTQPG